MTRWRKAVWWLAAGATIAAAAGTAANFYFSSARLTSLSRAKLQALSSRKISLDKVTLAWLPGPGLRITGLHVANAAWARDGDMLSVDTLVVQPSLLSLLEGKIVIPHLILSGVTMHLEAGAQEKNNWNDLLQSSSRGGDKATGASQNQHAFDVHDIAGVTLTNAHITYRPANGLPAAWEIDLLQAQAEPGWRAMQLKTEIRRDGHVLNTTLHLADASGLGKPGASSSGSLRLAWKQGELSLNGILPIALPAALQKSTTPPAIWNSAQGQPGRYDTQVHNPAFKLQLDASSLSGLLGFLDIDSQPIVPFKLAADIRIDPEWLHATNISATLGQQSLSGELQFSSHGARPQFKATLNSPRIDWAKLTADAGRPAPPPVPPDEVFYIHPLAWPALMAMHSLDGSLDLDIAAFRTRSNIEVADLHAGMQFHGDQLDVKAFRFNAFGGKADGSLYFDGPRQSARLKLQTHQISLGQWFQQKTGKDLFTGAPMDLNAQVSASGASMKLMAASLTGPVTVRVGPARVSSEKAVHAEAMLTGLVSVLSGQENKDLDLACINARLPFANGVARAAPIAGARSSASKLLTHGELDLRRQTITLRGRLRPYTGIHLGVASITGDVRIDGSLRHPGMHLDPLGSPGAVARVGAAILTSGLSLVATAAWDATVKGEDPCLSVFEKVQRTPSLQKNSTKN